MDQLGPVAAVVVVAYGFGAFWYHLLGQPHASWQRMLVFPLVGVILGEAIWVPYFAAGPQALGLHVVVALFASLIAVYVDIVHETGEIFPSKTIRGFHLNGASKLTRGKGVRVGAGSRKDSTEQ